MIGPGGEQIQHPDPWDPAAWTTPLDAMVAVRLEGRAVWIRPWLHLHACPHGGCVPLIRLDARLEENDPADRGITDRLYGADDGLRLKQEAVLGIRGELLDYDIDPVRERCVFTAHTPVEAGHDRFPCDPVGRVLGDFFELEQLHLLAGDDALNMTRLALNLSAWMNGVAARHAETARRMFPDYRIRAITNGVHVLPASVPDRRPRLGP